MSDPREALLEKFRATLRARVQKLRDMLGVLREIPENDDARAQVLGELHTLKGETRMLGLTLHSELAHALEGLLSHVDSNTIALTESALEMMARGLMDQIARADADSLIQSALDQISGGAPVTPAASPAAKAEQGEEAAVPIPLGGSERWVQVDARSIDVLCDSMAALSGDFGRILAQVNHLVGTIAGSNGGVRSRGSVLVEDCMRFRNALDDATVRTWGLRMVPVYPLLKELSSHAEDLAVAAGKSVNVTVDAGGVQIERNALDRIWDAMLHLVRNSIDHGLEDAESRGSKGPEGQLTISARTVGASVVLAVADDGRGIDADRVRKAALARQLLDSKRAQSLSDEDVIQFVFERGFSTSEKVSAMSGRGVGLDVVKARAVSLGGRVDVFSKVGVGTRFEVTLPFTLTKERLLIFELAGGLYGLPARSVHAVIGKRDLPTRNPTGSESIIRFEGEPVPLRSLAEVLGREPEPSGASLIVTAQDQAYGLLVARIVGERELIRRPAEPLLARTTAIAGSATMEDGRVVLMLDLVQIGHRIRRSDGMGAHAPSIRLTNISVPRVLLVDDSPVLREMVSEILASAGLRVTTATDGADAWAQIQSTEPDLVVSDIEMPKMDGFSLLEQIRQRTQRLPVVMLTTRASVQDRQRATTLGANAYVLKEDFRSDVLLDVVQRFVPLNR